METPTHVRRVDSPDWRPASSVHACRLVAKIGLPGWFVATARRATVKPPVARGIPVCFVPIFSVVTRFDVCLVGRYNCRMEFLGRTIAFEKESCSDFRVLFEIAKVY